MSGEDQIFIRKGKRIRLEAFQHQVGGHTPIFKCGYSTVCKAFNRREYFIYISASPELESFLPKLIGLMEVGYAHSEGDIEIYGQQIQLLDKDRFLYKKENQFLLKSDCPQKDVTEEVHRSSVEKLFLHSDRLQPSTGISNPYSNSTYVRALERLKDRKPPHYFTLLEDLTHSFSRPCVLDLKMGTRLYGDDASEERVVFHKIQSEMTTSCRLGVRVGGMQLFKREQNKYLCYGKHHGKALDDEGFKEWILVERLKTLRKIILKMDGWRFFSSSLLIIYEGFEASTSRIDIKMIDFTRSTNGKFLDDRIVHNGPDDGYILGINTLINIFENLGS
ncbi:DgyrCDS965 [Dimorphilus gyrociliatus]|uniref:Kinase n=1 Tax=Dimorphilus gyrociliatus TaxID=2664684 RepID=A0A7I8V8R1_9ANNE|nr:DgyrCDS965 [Dimorphilus gyrociliatus]